MATVVDRPLFERLVSEGLLWEVNLATQAPPGLVSMLCEFEAAQQAKGSTCWIWRLFSTTLQYGFASRYDEQTEILALHGTRHVENILRKGYLLREDGAHGYHYMTPNLQTVRQYTRADDAGWYYIMVNAVAVDSAGGLKMRLETCHPGTVNLCTATNQRHRFGTKLRMGDEDLRLTGKRTGPLAVMVPVSVPVRPAFVLVGRRRRADEPRQFLDRDLPLLTDRAARWQKQEQRRQRARSRSRTRD